MRSALPRDVAMATDVCHEAGKLYVSTVALASTYRLHLILKRYTCTGRTRVVTTRRPRSENLLPSRKRPKINILLCRIRYDFVRFRGRDVLSVCIDSFRFGKQTAMFTRIVVSIIVPI